MKAWLSKQLWNNGQSDLLKTTLTITKTWLHRTQTNQIILKMDQSQKKDIILNHMIYSMFNLASGVKFPKICHQNQFMKEWVVLPIMSTTTLWMVQVEFTETLFHHLQVQQKHQRNKSLFNLIKESGVKLLKRIVSLHIKNLLMPLQTKKNIWLMVQEKNTWTLLILSLPDKSWGIFSIL